MLVKAQLPGKRRVVQAVDWLQAHEDVAARCLGTTRTTFLIGDEMPLERRRSRISSKVRPLRNAPEMSHDSTLKSCVTV